MPVRHHCQHGGGSTGFEQGHFRQSFLRRLAKAESERAANNGPSEAERNGLLNI